MLEGEGVRSMTALFLQMWCILRQPEFEQFLSDPIPAAANAKGFVVPYGDCRWTVSGWAKWCTWICSTAPGSMCTSSRRI